MFFLQLLYTSCNDELRSYSVRSGFQQLVALLVDSCASALLAMGFRREIVPRLVHVVERPVMTLASAVGRAGEDRVRMPELGKHLAL